MKIDDVMGNIEFFYINHTKTYKNIVKNDDTQSV